MTWLWIVLAVVGGVAGLVLLFGVSLYIHLLYRYLDPLVRIFQEKPLFIVPRGQPVEGAEEVYFRTSDGLALHGVYVRSTAATRLGVILFGLEYGSNCWACIPYCRSLLENGFDVFTFEPRSSGDSETQPGYQPLQWVTDFEVRDMEAALGYLKARPDADRKGIGFFGISKGAAAGLLAGAREPSVRCFVTDGVFATYTTMIPYMQKWISIYSNRRLVQKLLPRWVYGLVGRTGLWKISRLNHCQFPHLEKVIGRVAPRPLLMIHGAADTYIKPEMALALFERAQQPKEFWLVEGARHNQAIAVAGEEYHQRVLAFFRQHLAQMPTATIEPLMAGRNGQQSSTARVCS